MSIAEIVNAATREIALEAALKDTRAWVEHWERDRQCKLTPTEGSLQACLSMIDAALAVSRPSDEAEQ